LWDQKKKKHKRGVGAKVRIWKRDPDKVSGKKKKKWEPKTRGGGGIFRGGGGAVKKKGSQKKRAEGGKGTKIVG